MRYILSTLLVLSLAGSAYAAGIPTVVSPTTEPEVWTMEVFNNSGGELTSGDVVIWDFDSSTGDDLSYITTTATNDSPYIAGVVYADSIASASVGTIAIRGVVRVNTSVANGASDLTVGDLCANGDTAAIADDWTDAADAGYLGMAVKAVTGDDASFMVNVNPGWGD